jgi:hypothetical protein
MAVSVAVSLLYWIGLLIVLAGLWLRFWLAWRGWALAVALVGLAMILLARVLGTLHRHRRLRHKEPPKTA